MAYKSTSIASKWTVTKWLLGSAATRPYVPKTLPFTRSNLRTILNRYSMVYFKPTNGTGGNHITRITKRSGGYQLHLNYSKKRVTTFDSLYRELKRRTKGNPYVLQKGIRLAKMKGRAFDVRVMVQKAKSGTWKNTAIFTKIGKPGKVTTNYHQGGRLGTFRGTLAKAKYGTARIARKERQLNKLGRSVGRVFDRHRRGFLELGLDVALDTKGKAWILEVNTRPAISPLKSFNRKMYNRVMHYARRYGRTY